MICDPAFGWGDIPEDAADVEMSLWRTYDFLTIMPAPARKSNCKWYLSREGNGENVVLRLRITMTPVMRGNQAAARRLAEEHDIVIPLFYDEGTRCVMPGQRSTPVQEAIPDLAQFVDNDEDTQMTDD